MLIPLRSSPKFSGELYIDRCDRCDKEEMGDGAGSEEMAVRTGGADAGRAKGDAGVVWVWIA